MKDRPTLIARFILSDSSFLLQFFFHLVLTEQIVLLALNKIFKEMF